MLPITIGCIGVGNMGGALLTAICQAVPDASKLISDHHREKTAHYHTLYGCVESDNRAIAETADVVVLGVKPQYLENLFEEIRPLLSRRLLAGQAPLLLTMAAGVSMEAIRTMAGGEFPVIRIMPNTPVSVGEGMILYTHTDNVTPEQRAFFAQMLSRAGTLDFLPENLIDAGGTLSGCGPAFVCLVLEGLADGGVACGLPRQKALLYGAQTLLGTARLLLESGEHPGVLKDAVTSPGGTTIAGVHAMERAGVRGAMMDAILAAYEKTLALKK